MKQSIIRMRDPNGKKDVEKELLKIARSVLQRKAAEAFKTQAKGGKG